MLSANTKFNNIYHSLLYVFAYTLKSADLRAIGYACQRELVIFPSMILCNQFCKNEKYSEKWNNTFLSGGSIKS